MSTFKQGDRVRVSPSPLASVRNSTDQPATVLGVRPGAYVVHLDTHAEPFRTLVPAALVSALTLVHDPEGWACNMGWALVDSDDTEVYRGPEWAARLRLLRAVSAP